MKHNFQFEEYGIYQEFHGVITSSDFNLHVQFQNHPLLHKVKYLIVNTLHTTHIENDVPVVYAHIDRNSPLFNRPINVFFIANNSTYFDYFDIYCREINNKNWCFHKASNLADVRDYIEHNILK